MHKREEKKNPQNYPLCMHARMKISDNRCDDQTLSFFQTLPALLIITINTTATACINKCIHKMHQCLTIVIKYLLLFCTHKHKHTKYACTKDVEEKKKKKNMFNVCNVFKNPENIKTLSSHGFLFQNI